jgi:hypothetical protein
MSPPLAPTIHYWIDAQDRIIRVDEHWAKFAAENDGGALRPERMVGQKLWSGIANPTLGALYRQLVGLARRGRVVRFRFRCDSPELRRLYEMEIRGGEGGLVEFASTLQGLEERPRVPLLDSRQARREGLVRVCSWCQRIAVPGGWQPVEAAIETLGLMQKPVLPALTHGICEECHTQMSALIADAEEADGPQPSP